MDLDEPIATGRDADIFDVGNGRVLRRSRTGASQEREASVMRHVAEQGYPAPRVFDVSDDGRDLVMERVDGPTMLDDLGRRPWLVLRHADTLAELHTRLGRIAAPEWLQAGPVPGDRVVHLDLHPGNVIVARTGPVVIDWTNAASGTPGSDVAATWLILACAEIPGPRWKATLLGVFRRALVSRFLRRAGRDAAARELRAMAEWKADDQNMHPSEIAAMRALVEREATV